MTKRIENTSSPTYSGEINFSHTSILIVDDETSCLHSLKRLLESFGANVTSARNGKTALQILEDKVFSLIILDIMMEDMDGWDIYGTIRQDLQDHDVPILFYSGLIDEKHAEFLNAGPLQKSYIVSKTSSPPELLTSISRLLHSEQPTLC
ncbi:MAG: response regulator [Verrucomicrobiota bacterium]